MPRGGAGQHSVLIPTLLISGIAAVAAVAFRNGPAVVVSTIVVLYAAGHLVTRQRSALAQKRAQVQVLAARLDEAQADVRHERARMHEINATVAGIASATKLIRTLPPAKRATLESMMEAEVERLLRVLDESSEAEIRPVDVDETIAHLVVSHRARGRQVAWTPSGLSVRARADDLAEAVNVLLENAARHGSPDDIRVEARQVGGRVEIAVTDGGAGVPAELRDRIFEWGESRPDSPGQGIGLHVARDLMRGLSGDLHLDVNDAAGGARFVITLPGAGVVTRRDLALAG